MYEKAKYTYQNNAKRNLSQGFDVIHHQALIIHVASMHLEYMHKKTCNKQADKIKNNDRTTVKVYNRHLIEYLIKSSSDQRTTSKNNLSH